LPDARTLGHRRVTLLTNARKRCRPRLANDPFFLVGDFRNLPAWKEAAALVVLSRDAIQRLPSNERYALGDQWRRAAHSVALNIAEGASRRGSREFRRYLDIARASLHELEAILELVTLLGYLAEADLVAVKARREHCAKLVYGLLKKMSASGAR